MDASEGLRLLISKGVNCISGISRLVVDLGIMGLIHTKIIFTSSLEGGICFVSEIKF